MTLKIRNISKTYPNGVQALKNVTLTIPNGMYGLLGPNGAGKSTLMRILATLQEPDEGSVHLFPSLQSAQVITAPRKGIGSGNSLTGSAGTIIDVIEEKDEVRKTLGYLPQEFGVYPKAKADELLEHFAILKGFSERRSRKEVVETLLRKTNLWDVRKQKLGGYSGGMRQRFGVAVALLGDPKLMIVDEPTAGLDPAERVRFLNLLSELGENSVVLLSTHIVDDVSELCTRMAIINKGEILYEAEPLKAMEGLKGRIWRKIIEKGALPQLEREHRIISTKLLGGRTVVHVYSEEGPAGFEMVQPDLEDVYFSAMAGEYRHKVGQQSKEA
jgi:ABC-2 type transport system ATP-binding protein